MKKLLPVLLILVFTLSCKEKNVSKNVKVCGVSDPIRNLPWLRDLVEKAKTNKEENMMTISIAKIGNETVINYSMLYMSCIGCQNFNCDGTRVDMTKFTEAEIRDYQSNFWGDKEKRIVLWPEK